MNKLESRFKFGVWVGLDSESGEAIVLTPQGKAVARTVRRLEEGKRHDREFLEACKGLPWHKYGENEEGDGEAVEADEEADNGEIGLGSREWCGGGS